jgi:aryl-alcohol dehydrogenase-like predicted oxidoreductase
MQSLNTLVQQRKVLYLGISDTPAWVVMKANCYARDHGLRPFSVYQGRWSALLRDLEREIVPMCRDQGMAIHPWGVMGNGRCLHHHACMEIETNWLIACRIFEVA